MASAKLTMLLDLSNKLFNSKFAQMQNKFEQGIGKMKVKFRELTSEIPGMGRAMDLLGNKWVLLGAGIVAMGGLAMKGANSVEQFDAAFLNIQQLNLDKPKSELDSYRNSVRDAAYSVGTDLKESTQAMYDLQSATGLYGDDAIEIFKKVGTYSVATGANLNDSINSTTKAMKAFGLEVKDIDKLLESNAKTVQTGITTFDELAKVQTQYAGATSAAGQSVDVGNKVFAMFTSITKNSDIGANMTKTFFDGLGQQASKFKDVLNIDVFDEKGMARGADKILMDVSEKFKHMNDKEITEAINKIGGPEGMRGALAKVKTGADDMIATFNAFDNSKFSLEKALENAKDDPAKMKELFFNRLNIVFSKLGDIIMPMLIQVFEKLNPMLDWAYTNFDDIVSVLKVMVPLVLGLMVFSKVAAAFKAAAIATEGLTVAQWLLNMAMNANPIGLIVLGIAALIAFITIAIVKWDEFGAGMLFLLGPIGMIINAVMLLRAHWDSISDAFTKGGIIEGLKRIGVVLLDLLLKPIQQLLEMVSHIPGLGHLAQGGANKIKELRTNLNLVTPEEQKEKIKSKSENTDLYGGNKPPVVPGGLPANGDAKLTGDVAKVTGDAKQVKNINIKIDSLHRGDFNMNSTEAQGMTLQQVEDWFNEAMMRIIRNAELT